MSQNQRIHVNLCHRSSSSRSWSSSHWHSCERQPFEQGSRHPLAHLRSPASPGIEVEDSSKIGVTFSTSLSCEASSRFSCTAVRYRDTKTSNQPRSVRSHLFPGVRYLNDLLRQSRHVCGNWERGHICNLLRSRENNPIACSTAGNEKSKDKMMHSPG